MSMPEDIPEPTEIEALLPWHAAGTLDASEARMVEAAIAKDPELARRYAAVREEFNADWQINEGLGVPSLRAMDQLFAKIDAEPRRRGVASFDVAGGFARLLERLSFRARGWAMAAASLLIVAQGGVLGVLATRVSQVPSSAYGLAGTEATAPAPGAYVLVRFAPGTKAVEITRLLAANNASIVEGPRADGFYKLKVADKPLPKVQLASIAKHLGEDKAFEFVSATE
jgi:hypothetical protein